MAKEPLATDKDEDERRFPWPLVLGACVALAVIGIAAYKIFWTVDGKKRKAADAQTIDFVPPPPPPPPPASGDASSTLPPPLPPPDAGDPLRGLQQILRDAAQ